MLRPDLSNPTNWNFRVSLTRNAPRVVQRFEAIDPIDYEQILTSPILLVESLCSHALSNWTTAGSVEQFAPVGFLIGQDEQLHVTTRSLRLGQQLVYFPDLNFPQFKIRFVVPRWFNQVTYNVYEYTGDGAASTQGKIDRFYDDYINGV